MSMLCMQSPKTWANAKPWIIKPSVIEPDITKLNAEILKVRCLHCLIL